ncbi:EcoRII N-terminal effector-binding domain-containing protein [Reyranella sp.]|uniref:EcoRII N-terminal effector-binding domain-containing protein n=1 Tax=Reyranella sp. TaxID=1929291 RepID=UPI003D0A89A3
MTVAQITKTLSANDTGETGGHQAGMLVPKDERILAFFPRLQPRSLNPRCHLFFRADDGTNWEFAFIYYNNRHFGGTRNEYRLTRMTKYIRQKALNAGDTIILSRESPDEYRICHRRAKQTDSTPGVLKLGSGWRIVQI